LGLLKREYPGKGIGIQNGTPIPFTAVFQSDKSLVTRGEKTWLFTVIFSFISAPVPVICSMLEKGFRYAETRNIG
jgi:hypothetical protein